MTSQMGHTRQLGQLSVNAMGLGCMPMSWAYGVDDIDPIEVRATLREAIDLGVTLLDTSDVYGPYTNEELLGVEIVDAGLRDKVQLATKCGLKTIDTFKYAYDGTPEHVRAACDASLKRLKVEHIDLYQLHRIDPKTPIEETWGAMAELVTAGKVGAIGLSEASLENLKRAQAIHPLTTLQSELSLWSQDVLENGILDWCKENSVGFLAFSPLGRGFLTGEVLSVSTYDFRAANPRFTEAAMAENQKIVDAISAIAKRVQITNAQLALAWVLAQGKNVVPIPGTKRRKWLRQNVAALEITLDAATLAELANIPRSTIPRY